MSEWLLDKRGFLPVPIIITEPAVGDGGGVALVFFSESLRDSAAHAKESGHMVPPDIYGVGGFKTENDTWGAAGGAMLSFDDDGWRYRGALAKTSANLDFYGIGHFDDLKIGYNLSGWVSTQQVLRRLGASNNYLGMRWLYLNLETQFDFEGLQHNRFADRLPTGRELSERNSGLGFSLEHDSRDNMFSPSRGWTGALETLFYDSAWGSDNRLQSYRAHIFAYTPLGSSLVLAGRADARMARGDVPFYQQPSIDLRGISMGKYQDENTLVFEGEVRWNTTPRWALVGFVGAGRAWGRQPFGDTEVTKGGGFRYLLARRLGLYVGVDYAFGPDEEAYYIQVGNAWR
jgi:outer membrane protein assembly factor BamA